MNENKIYCDYTVGPKEGSAVTALKVGLLIGYTLFIAAYVFIATLLLDSWQLLLLLPFIMLALFKLTWRYTCVEYEYSIEAGRLTVAEIYDRRSRRPRFAADLSDAVKIQPREQVKVDSPEFSEVRDFTVSGESAYFIIFPEKKGGKKSAVIIETNDDLLHLLRLSNPTAFVRR